MAETTASIRSGAAADDSTALLDAAEREFAERGLGSASLDSVARAAGLSRSTLYRRYPNKAALVAAVLDRTRRVVTRDMQASIAGLSPGDAVVEAFTVCFRWLRRNPLVRRLLVEDSALWTQVTGPIREWTVTSMSGTIAENLRAAGSTMPEDRLRTVAEILVRLTVSYIETPTVGFDPDDDASVRRFAETHLAPLVG